MKARPHYISNAPIGEDQFKGQSHKRIAHVLTVEILEGHPRMIGLDGGWGSGKSNLIKLVDLELNGVTKDKDKKYPVIVYDAWGHVSDLQRRSILEEVTSSLIHKHNALGTVWSNKLEELLAKRKATKSKKVPALSTSLVTLLISVLLTPLIGYFMTLSSAGSIWKWLLPVIYVVSIFGLMIGECIYSIKKHGQKCDISTILGEMFMLYQGKISEDTTYEVVSENEPSSRQFKDWMHALDDDLSDKVSRVILVFDNLDRLPVHKVQELWAAIHSFFAEEKYNKITVIVPFDRQHVINAFKSENHDDETRSYGDDFINKTFDVVYRVSPMILSDWKVYFGDKWEEAFGKGSPIPTAVTQIYDAFTKNITPRNIVSFINEFVTIYQTTNKEIPGQYIALFIFGKKKIEDNPQTELLSPSFLGSLGFLYENDVDVPKYLSALYYQLPVESAMDVVFTRKCQQALDNNTPDTLSELIVHQDIFVSVVENAILDISNIENTTLCLNSLDISNYPQDLIDRLWTCVYRKVQFEVIEKEEVKDYHMILLKHLPTQNMRERFAKAMIKGYRYSEENNADKDNYVKGVRLLNEYDKDIAAKAISQCWNISAELFIRLVERAGDDWHLMAISIQDKDLDTYLASLEVEQLNNLTVMPLLEGFYKVENLKQYNQSLRDKASQNSTDLDNFIVILARLKEIERPILNINSLISDNNIYTLSQSEDTHSEGFYELLSIALSRGTSYTKHSSGKIYSVLSSPDREQIINVADRLEAYVDYGDLLLDKNGFSNFELHKRVIQEITTKSHGISRCYLKDCILGFDNSVENFDLEPTKLFARLSQWKSEDISFTTEEMENLPIRVVEQANIQSNSLSVKMCEQIHDYLNGISQTEWENFLQRDSKALKIYLAFRPTKYQTLVDATLTIIKDTIVNSQTAVPIPSLKEILEHMMNAGEQLNAFFTSIVDLISTGYRQTSSIFCSLAPWVFKLAHESLNDSNKFERFIPSDILENSSVISILKNNRTLLAKYKKPEQFKNKLKQMATTTYKSDSGFVEFVKGLGLLKEKKDK